MCVRSCWFSAPSCAACCCCVASEPLLVLPGQSAPLRQLVAAAALDRLHRDARLLEPPARLCLRSLLGPPVVEHAPQHRVLNAQQPLELLDTRQLLAALGRLSRQVIHADRARRRDGLAEDALAFRKELGLTLQ